ncbi:MAG: BlaI/MecI/CopY family transcriptional regulator [Bacteroidia bacterium]|nr:BlaI/MecI/CopY family transcriptional regulator [Bacteroidia bacterium]
MQKLTKAEEQVMRVLWRLEKAYLKDVVDDFPAPKPAYTTISTVMRVLVKKEFIGYKSYGKVNEYYPLLSKEKYFGIQLKGMIKNFFDGSNRKFTSFFTENQDLDLKELEEMKQLLEHKIDELKKKNE